MIENYSQQVKYKEPLLLFHNQADEARERQRAGRARSSPSSFPRAASPSATTTTTAASTCSSATTAKRRVLLKNNAGEGNHWLGLKLQGTACNRDAIGALITWSVGGAKTHQAEDAAAAATSRHTIPREVLGLGTATSIDYVEIKWPQPSGRVERFTDLPIDRYVTVVEGKGKVET